MDEAERPPAALDAAAPEEHAQDDLAGGEPVGLKLVHTADWHLGRRFPAFLEEEQKKLSRARMDVVGRILDTARRRQVHAVLCAGDLFDDSTPAPDFWEGLAKAFHDHPTPDAPVFLVPRNHDPLTPDSVYRRAEFVTPANVSVLGLTVNEKAEFPSLGLEVWGRAHVDYLDMSPLHTPAPRSPRWRVTALHGHSVDWGRLADWDPANWALVLLATSLPVGSIYFGSDLVAKVLHHRPTPITAPTANAEESSETLRNRSRADLPVSTPGSITANVKPPNGTAAQKPLTITFQKVVGTQGGQAREGRWIITDIKGV